MAAARKRARPIGAEDLTEQIRALFWAHADSGEADTCWVWTGLTYAATRYGRLKLDKVEYLAHRVSYAIAHCSVPADGHVCHHCDNPPCVNRDAKGRLHNARKTHCLRGHPFDGENLFIRSDGGRGCRQCHRARGQATTVKRKAARGATRIEQLGAAS